MTRSKITAVQIGGMPGAGLNRFDVDYKIYDTPQGDVGKYGLLAYVSAEDRERILQSAYGELESQLEHIARHVKYVKKYHKGSRPREKQGELI